MTHSVAITSPASIPLLESVLIIDDNKANRALHEYLIENAGIAQKVITCSGAKEALQLLEEYRKEGTFPPLILVDLYMPWMNGFSFAEAYQQQGYNQQDSLLVLLTSSANPADKIRVLKAGFSLYLPKPLEEEQLYQLRTAYFAQKR